MFWIAALVLLASLQAQPTLQITSPANDAVFSPGQNIAVTVRASEDISFVSIIGENPLGFTMPLSAAPYEFSITIPKNIAQKRYMLTAVGKGPQDTVFSPTITIVVRRSDSPVSLRAEPPVLELDIGRERRLRVSGTYNDGFVDDLTEAASTTFASRDPVIAKVDAQGGVTAVSAGSTTILVNGSLEVPVTVLPAITVAPLRRSLYSSQSQRFFPRLSDSSAASVAWSIDPPGVGSVDGLGVYTAPPSIASAQTILLKAKATAGSDSATVTITLLPGSAPDAPRKPSCDEISHPELTMVDLVPDLLLDSGMITDPEVLATTGREVSGVVADGAATVLLRLKAGYAGERIQITVLNLAGEISSSTSEEGAFAEIPSDESVPFESMRFVPGQVVTTAVTTSKGAVAFALYRSAQDFVREPSDLTKASHELTFQMKSLGLPCPQQ